MAQTEIARYRSIYNGCFKTRMILPANHEALIERIILSVCLEFGVVKENILSKSSKHKHVLARKSLCYVLKRLKIPQKYISRYILNRKETAIKDYCNEVKSEMKIYGKLNQKIESIIDSNY